MKRSLSYELFIFLFSFFMIITSCKKENSPTDSDTNNSSEWKTGDSKTYPIPSQANSTLKDNISNFTFRFPSGGNGELKITRVTSGPNVNETDSVFKVEYGPNVQVQMIIKQSAEHYNSLVTYLKFDDASLNEKNEYGWFPVQNSLVGTDIIFDLPPKNLSKTNRYLHAGFEIYKNYKIKKGSSYDEYVSKYSEKIYEVLNKVYEVIPQDRKSKFLADVNNDAKPRLYIAMNNEAYFFNSTKEKYVPFWDILFMNPCRYIMLTNNSSSGNIAHETGHYIHHMLVGNSKFSQFAVNHRPSDHRIGSTGAANQLIEEPAYFTEYYLTGKCGGNGSPESGQFAINDGSGQSVSPSKTNMLDVEGMSAAMFASLIRTDSSIRDFESKFVSVPVISSQSTNRSAFVQDIYEIIAQGTDNISSARTKFETVLAKYNQSEKLPAMLEPLGWTYFGQGKILDKDGMPIHGAKVKSICKIGEVTYSTRISDPTSVYGIYSLSRIYPGNSTLRVYVGNDSMDVSNYINWDTKTNQAVSLKDITFSSGSALINELKACSIFKLYVNCKVTCTNYPFDYISGVSGLQLFNYINSDHINPISWKENEFSFSYVTPVDIYNITITCNGKIAIDGTLEYLKATYTHTQGRTWVIEVKNLVKNNPYSYNGWEIKEKTLTENNAGLYITKFTFSDWRGSISSYDWSSFFLQIWFQKSL